MRNLRGALLLIVSVFSSALLAIPAQPASAAAPFDLIKWNGGKFIYGADYYPEAWGADRVEKDAEMMQAAGINFVRMGEFSWAKMEPKDGQFDFSWLDKALKVLSAHGIHAVLGTPTASPPAWLYAEHPDIAAMNEDGVRYRFGSRRNYCLHNPYFLEATRRIVTAEAEHFKNNPAVIGWQIDNELGNPYCYDSYCLAAFQNWCQKKYGTLDALNKAWGTIFWGHTYTAWSEIPLPWNTLFGVHNPSLGLDYDRFFSDSTADYLAMQANILRKIAPDKAITHNEMGLFDGVDYSHLSQHLDFVAWDNYPMFDQDQEDYFGPALGHDLMRGTKQQNFMVMEEEAGLPGWNIFWGHQAPAKLYRVWAYQAIAHGADGVCYFRWRTSTYGTEQYWQGILDQDSYPNQRYKVISQMGGEVQKLARVLEGSHVISPVAMLVSPDSRWAFHIQPLTKDFSYNHELHVYYDAFRRAGINVAVVFPQDDLSAYKVVVAPALFVTTPALVEKLTQFVDGGGTLVLTFRSGVKNENNVVTTETFPGPLAKLAGIAIHNFDPQTTQNRLLVMDDGGSYPAVVWYDIITPEHAEPLASYGNGFYTAKGGFEPEFGAAITMHRAGEGMVYYVGTESSSTEFYDRFVGSILLGAHVAEGPKLPKGVEMATREKSGEKIIFLLNYTDRPHSIALGETTQNALTGESQASDVEIPPYGVRVLTEGRKHDGGSR
jgi:beta-galactosidase